MATARLASNTSRQTMTLAMPVSSSRVRNTVPRAGAGPLPGEHEARHDHPGVVGDLGAVVVVAGGDRADAGEPARKNATGWPLEGEAGGGVSSARARRTSWAAASRGARPGTGRRRRGRRRAASACRGGGAPVTGGAERGLAGAGAFEGPHRPEGGAPVEVEGAEGIRLGQALQGVAGAAPAPPATPRCWRSRCPARSRGGAWRPPARH